MGEGEAGRNVWRRQRRRGLPAILAGAATVLALAGCQKPAARDARADAGIDAAAYLAPPTIASAVRDPAGGVTLSGAAPEDAEVRLRDPNGAAFSATADDGAWSIQLPPDAAPRMFAFEGEVSGRVIHGEGAVLVLPPPGPAAVLTRAGYGALVLGAGGGPLRITAIDDDGGGGGSVSGTAPPQTLLRLVLDGRAVGAGQADDKGRFTLLDLTARNAFGPGGHTVRVESPTGAVEGRTTVTPAAPLTNAPFRATRDDGAWRVDWRIPGGGTQTSMVFDAPAGRAAP